MNLAVAAISAAERLPLPDKALRFGIDQLVGRTEQKLASGNDNVDADFARAMDGWPIAVNTTEANDQHYELPPAFFEIVLGPRRKYSCCLYPDKDTTLEDADLLALDETCRHAMLEDGQTILELGCGWGSLSLFMAERFPGSRILSVSNSAPQRRHIEAQIAKRGLTNLVVVTADMNAFSYEGRFDRIVSVEMFEHMSNWRLLLERARGWLHDDGRMFIHVFSHRNSPYRFDHADPADWIAQYFFTAQGMRKISTADCTPKSCAHRIVLPIPANGSSARPATVFQRDSAGTARKNGVDRNVYQTGSIFVVASQ